MKFEEVEQKVISAIDKLHTNDKSLIKNNVNERTISSRLGLYLASEFSDYNVDCEYNRNKEEFDQKKYIYEIEYLLGEIIKDKQCIIPDIIVHRREVNINNLLIIEMKKTRASQNQVDRDQIKLKAATTKFLSNLDYKFGLYIEVEVGENATYAKLKWFSKGEIIKESSLNH